MPKKKSRALRKLERKIVKQNDEQEAKSIDDVETEVSKYPKESEEGLGIEEEEEKVQEPYPEIEKDLEHEDNPEKSDEEEE